MIIYHHEQITPIGWLNISAETSIVSILAWISVFDKKYRARCIEIGKKTGLYKGEMVSKGYTPNYLPEFIAMESDKKIY